MYHLYIHKNVHIIINAYQRPAPSDNHSSLDRKNQSKTLNPYIIAMLYGKANITLYPSLTLLPCCSRCYDCPGITLKVFLYYVFMCFGLPTLSDDEIYVVCGARFYSSNLSFLCWDRFGRSGGEDVVVNWLVYDLREADQSITKQIKYGGRGVWSWKII